MNFIQKSFLKKLIDWTNELWTLKNRFNVAEYILTFSSSLRLAGETSECLRKSGLRGGARPLPKPPLWLIPWQLSFASLWRLCNASSTGTSSNESVDSWVTIGCPLEANFRRHTLQRHACCQIRKTENNLEQVIYSLE